MKKNIIINLFMLILLDSCQSQTTLERVNEQSKTFTRKAMYMMDSVYVLRKQKDTLKYLQAISYLDSAIYYDSTNYFAYWKESQFLFELKRYNDALYVISNYSKSHKNNMNFLLREAYLCEKVGDSLSAFNKYKYILKASEDYLLKETQNKKLMMVKYFMLLLLKDNSAGNYLSKLKNQFPQDKEIENLAISSKNFNKSQFLDYQLSGGESEDIQIH